MPANKQKIINQPINSLPFSEDFKSVTQKLGLNTIKAMIEIPVADLLELKGFNYHLLQELIQYLEERGIANLLNE